jgi:hypothetical protein
MTRTPWSSTDLVPVRGLRSALSVSRVYAAVEVGAPILRAEEPLDDEPADGYPSMTLGASGEIDLTYVGASAPNR